MPTTSHPLPVLLAFALICACDRSFSDPSRALGAEVPAETARYPTEIHQPTTLGAVDTTVTDIHGTPVGVGCETCHTAGSTTAIATDGPADLHQDLKLEHGALTCNSCHDPDDRAGLRLADGTKLEMSDAIQLCAQCHGPQWRDYSHGAHGGMTGHWDTRRGPRERNHCADCHAPHSPKIRQVEPAFKPVALHAEETH